ncbi:MAG TPA: glutathione S-transferase family protein [Devosia sp.]|nr:glutathione S-transferase family protein [Devosia sp.]
MKLLIGNKNYSSWSLRPWLVLKHFDIAFEEEMLLLNGENWKQKMIEATPNGCVPVLVDGDLVIAETIAIIEYLADRFPGKAIWPVDIFKRAQARAAAAEMHAGFSALRNAAPMNLRASHPGRICMDEVGVDIARLEDLLGGLLKQSGGPFLFGEFCAADAMFAPVAGRIKTYEIPVSERLEDYFDAIYELGAFKQWLSDALKETWIVEMDEIDFIQGK